MPRRSPGPSVKDKKLYEELRDEGNSKEKSARIANAAAARGGGKKGRAAIGRKGGESGSYDDWTVADLRKRAAEIGIDGRSKMNKGELISALRNH